MSYRAAYALAAPIARVRPRSSRCIAALGALAAFSVVAVVLAAPPAVQ
jgi:hypothetical protein